MHALRRLLGSCLAVRARLLRALVRRPSTTAPAGAVPTHSGTAAAPGASSAPSPAGGGTGLAETGASSSTR
ncbi:hypothetical protein ACH4UM_36010 [Streptomyces sp. NPDC020801]|uniref:hypothetical protein n=1 Tax=unclassified Streptomyces TaxID=2593676 RepID=UPI00379D89FF